MPDLLTHFGTGYLALRGAAARREAAFILVGTLLPDLAWVARRALSGIFHLDPVTLSLWLIPWHTPWMMLLAAAAITLLTRGGARRFLLLCGAAWLHILLDAAQTRYGNGVLLLYPLSLRETSWQLFWPESLLNQVLALGSLLFLLALIFGLVDRPAAIPREAPAARPADTGRGRALRLGAAAACLLAALGTAAATRGRLVRANVYQLAFALRPEAFEGTAVAFDRDRIVRAAPPVLESFAGRRFKLSGVQGLRPGDVISLDGIYEGGRVVVQRWHRHRETVRSLYSYVALLLLPFALWRLAAADRRRTGAGAAL